MASLWGLRGQVDRGFWVLSDSIFIRFPIRILRRVGPNIPKHGERRAGIYIFFSLVKVAQVIFFNA